MRLFILSIIISLTSGVAIGQTSQSRLYDPFENASQAIAAKVKMAKATGKHVIVQVGNNGCGWCYRFNNLTNTDKIIDSLVKKNFIFYHLNTSPENKNEKLLAKYRFPQRFGYPAFLILNGKGALLHTQNSVYLEEGSGYNREKVIEFLEQWSPKALDPVQYK